MCGKPFLFLALFQLQTASRIQWNLLWQSSTIINGQNPIHETTVILALKWEAGSF